MNTYDFLDLLASFSSSAVFNPYRDTCAISDLSDAPEIRLENIGTMLTEARRRQVDTLWVARDLGYRGGRRTGIALTDEIHLDALGELFGTKFHRATHGTPVAERTASVIWEIIRAFNKPVFLWNVFPFHPHEGGNPLTNRCHTKVERGASRHILLALIEILQPVTIIAIGNDAENGLAELGIPAARVRHPSYGGKSDFISGLSQLYGYAPPLSLQSSLAL